MDYSFVSFDDVDYITDNPHIRQGLTAKGAWWAFTTIHANNWHPLTWIAHMVDVSLFGMNPGMHHLVNVALHAANGAILFVLLTWMTGALWRSALVASLFTIHPLHVESVAWVSERKDLLCAFFVFMTMLAYKWYCERPGKVRYATVTATYILALLAKPMAVTLPFVLVLLDYWPLGRLAGPRGNSIDNCVDFLGAKPFRSILVEKIPLFFLSIASCGVTFIAQRSQRAVVSVEDIPVVWRVGNALWTYSAYLGQTVWPSSLSVYYPHPVNTLSPWNIAAACLVIALITYIALRERIYRPWILVGWLWYLGMLIPVVGLVQVGGQARADRYTYLPLIGIFLMVVWGVGEQLQRRNIAKVVSVFGAGTVLVVLAVVAQAQTRYWENNFTLYYRAVTVTERNWLAHHNLGLALLDAGKHQEALTHFREVFKFQPRYPDAHYNAGVTLEAMGKMEEAIAEYRAAIQLKPDYTDALINLGQLLGRKGVLEEATSLLREVVQRNPDLPEGHHNLGVALLRGGDVDEAIVHFGEALRLAPANEKTRRMLAVALSTRGGQK